MLPLEASRWDSRGPVRNAGICIFSHLQSGHKSRALNVPAHLNTRSGPARSVHRVS